jgi:hypothetical protein
MERAAALHQGPFLEGFESCSEEFEEWLMAERRRLDETLDRSSCACSTTTA